MIRILRGYFSGRFGGLFRIFMERKYFNGTVQYIL